MMDGILAWFLGAMCNISDLEWVITFGLLYGNVRRGGGSVEDHFGEVNYRNDLLLVNVTRVRDLSVPPVHLYP